MSMNISDTYNSKIPVISNKTMDIKENDLHSVDFSWNDVKTSNTSTNIYLITILLQNGESHFERGVGLVSFSDDNAQFSDRLWFKFEVLFFSK